MCAYEKNSQFPSWAENFITKLKMKNITKKSGKTKHYAKDSCIRQGGKWQPTGKPDNLQGKCIFTGPDIPSDVSKAGKGLLFKYHQEAKKKVSKNQHRRKKES